MNNFIQMLAILITIYHIIWSWNEKKEKKSPSHHHTHLILSFCRVQTPEGDEAARRGIENPKRYVMKPQREGGGMYYVCTFHTPALSYHTSQMKEVCIEFELI